jgi:transglutaminase-like putative cysteine protease
MTTLLEVSHETRYGYPAPVTLAHHLAHLKPLHDAHQQRLAFVMQVWPEPPCLLDDVDALGNEDCHFSLGVSHRELRVRATSRVRIEPRFAALDAQASPPWDTLAASLRYVARAPFQPAVQFAMPSPYVPRWTPLRDWALRVFSPGRPVAAAAVELMQVLHEEFSYQSQSTDVDTPLAQVWTERRGVCQDFAHLLAGALRMLGLPARYVSGYLLTQAPEGGATMQGADASHAWVQVWCPGTPGVPDNGPGAGWLDLDPTNNLVPGSGHVRVAVGRDFGDVTPLRGVIRGGGGKHRLTVEVHTRVIEPTDPGPERELLETP